MPSAGAILKSRLSPFAEILCEDDADDVLVIAIGHAVSEALRAHHQLQQEGIGVTVVNGRFVKPLDQDLIVSLAERIPRIITVEDNVRQGGFGSAVLEMLVDSGLTHFQMERLGIDDVFVSHGPQQLLRRRHQVDAAAIAAAAKRLLPRSRLQATVSHS